MRESGAWGRCPRSTCWASRGLCPWSWVCPKASLPVFNVLLAHSTPAWSSLIAEVPIVHSHIVEGEHTHDGASEAWHSSLVIHTDLSGTWGPDILPPVFFVWGLIDLDGLKTLVGPSCLWEGAARLSASLPILGHSSCSEGSINLERINLGKFTLFCTVTLTWDSGFPLLSPDSTDLGALCLKFKIDDTILLYFECSPYGHSVC